ncbi:DoxX family protein [Nocardia sp. CDC159]|uniref:DoxX family protein n=1 Tax=Nocardia pulmonis TaxID=2951408 RepID=A0A9X2E4D8_9NOCA|nr:MULTISPECIES: DoxX family protein [Nocardia]MCM6774029.1 DoxX family protein [Nocardia pulmonis]MCM6786916.1 DoxX family protein [Nocardia sp. CDC159]
MSTDTVLEPIRDDPDAVPQSPPRWSLATRFGFRFCFAYFALFYITTGQLIVAPLGWAAQFLPEAVLTAPGKPVQPLVSWAGTHVFGVDLELDQPPATGSGDTAANWVTIACLLFLAVVAAVVWSLLDSRRAYPLLLTIFRLVLRFGLAATMFGYGFAKIFPAQMPMLLHRYVQPFGDMSPMGVLWTQIGASQPYQIALGAAEALAGVLLILPWTVTAGALLALLSMAQVFLLNMTYDVPVKLFSLHLLVQAALLLAPESRRLAGFLTGRAIAATSVPPPGRSRIALAAQLVLGLWIMAGAAHAGWTGWQQLSHRSPLHGIWDVGEFTLNGQPRPPLTTDGERIRRIVFDRVFDGPAGPTTGTAVQSMSDGLRNYAGRVDIDARSIELVNPQGGAPYLAVVFDRPAPDRMVLDGTLRGQPVRMVLQRIDETKLPLPSRGFHWVQEFPYNR